MILSGWSPIVSRLGRGSLRLSKARGTWCRATLTGLGMRSAEIGSWARWKHCSRKPSRPAHTAPLLLRVCCPTLTTSGLNGNSRVWGYGTRSWAPSIISPRTSSSHSWLSRRRPLMPLRARKDEQLRFVRASAQPNTPRHLIHAAYSASPKHISKITAGITGILPQRTLHLENGWCGEVG